MALACNIHIHVYIQDTPLEWPCLQTKARNYRNDRSKMNQNTMDLYYTDTWLRYGLQPGHIIGLLPAPQVDNWTPRHGQSCNCFAGNDSSTRTCIATSCPRQPTDVIYSYAAYSFWGYARISYSMDHLPHQFREVRYSYVRSTSHWLNGIHHPEVAIMIYHLYIWTWMFPKIVVPPNHPF